MDTLRGQFSDHGAPAEEKTEEMDTVVENEAPAAVGQDERRMQVRAYNFWASLLGDRTFPHTDDLRPETIEDFGQNSVLLDFSEGIENPLVGFVGEMLAQECDVTEPMRTLADVPSRSLLSRITDHYMQILANQAPIGFEAEFVNQRGTTVLYRGILLPFSRDDAEIDAILGVINWKSLSESDAKAHAQAAASGNGRGDSARIPAMLREAAPMSEWADGPVDLNFAASDPRPSPLELPVAQFGLIDPAGPSDDFPVPTVDALNDLPCELADWLAAAREDARVALGCESRSREALYAAIGRAYDFALAAEEDRETYALLLEDAGLTMQERAPLVPLVKLVFGAQYDKTRVTEYATAIAHGQRLGVARGALHELLVQTPGGLKAVIRAERDLRRVEAGDTTALRARHEDLLDALRRLPPKPLDPASEGPEFAVLVARRTPDGQFVMLGEIDDDERLLDRAARHLLN